MELQDPKLCPSVSESDRSRFVKFFRWLFELGQRGPRDLAKFAKDLKIQFERGVEVHDRQSRTWFATLDAIHADDNEVSTLVRLSRHRPEAAHEVRNGPISFEERGRRVYATPGEIGLDSRNDLVLMYSFAMFDPLPDELKVFREFAQNELERLRSEGPTNPEEILSVEQSPKE